MEDYYRVRFKRLVAPPLPRDGPGAVRMPGLLRIIYAASVTLVALGWVAVVGVGRSGPPGPYNLFALLVVSFPVAVALALGFSERQRWTRPLISALMLLSGGCLYTFLPGVGIAVLLLGIGVVIYLYGASGSRAYYAYLREESVVRVSAADLRSATFLPLYTGFLGLATGAFSGYMLTTQSLSWSNGPNDAVAIILVSILLGSLLAVVGVWIGEALVARRRRAAE